MVGKQSFENTFNLRLQIGLNTNLLYHSDHLSEGEEDPGSQLAFLLVALLLVAPVTLSECFSLVF